ncbi:hypothetical protein Nther_1988 [Natranaerobius thermophilus JW/NM-WN-LF]|uniref:DUF6946 domain-containing protein n=1 Tax=Natranaerobius thermophilus (strain ATCC BAA-1301 / DSM 18059 / JW/NM-WN-LF) TaxID=457570 RepID=B2A6M2_NATTJ|nr:hypothetical protein [Natranaerobius thermophilus]ACB85555.1 hypothetical protein Nther_1988 [Natranaerobius thermophilus JW/NM-WN-LF]
MPIDKPEDWKMLLAKPDKHWKSGCSAKALAYSWQEANGFPESVKKAFINSNIKLFREMRMIFAFPEYKVPLPGGNVSHKMIFL